LQTLYKLLTNKTYVGLGTYKDAVHPGEHPAATEWVANWTRGERRFTR
jgi:hypothetical protein